MSDLVFPPKTFFLTYKIDLAHFCSNSYDKVHKMSLFLEGSVGTLVRTCGMFAAIVVVCGVILWLLANINVCIQLHYYACCKCTVWLPCVVARVPTHFYQ